MAKNLYDVLGVAPNATREQIRARFLELARLRHPDRFQGAEKERAEKEFQEITAAFNLLSDSERRRQHDAELKRPAAGQTTADQGQVVRAYMQRGAKAYREGNYLEAAANFDRATKSQPDNAKAWHHLALAASRQENRLSRAVSAIAEACELEPMNSAYLKLAGRLFETAGMSLRAEQYYSESLKWGGEDPAVQARLEGLRKKSKKGMAGFFGKVGS